MYEDAMKITEEIFGHNHPNVALICDNIATSYRDVGSLPKAEEYYNTVANIRLSLYSPVDD